MTRRTREEKWAFQDSDPYRKRAEVAEAALEEARGEIGRLKKILARQEGQIVVMKKQAALKEGSLYARPVQ